MATKIYTVVKDGEALKELKTLAAAKRLADADGAEVLCDGECVYRGTVTDDEGTVTDTVEEKVTEAPTPEPAKFTLTAKMNIRKAPSMNAEKAGIAQKGTVVEVAAIEDDWLCLTEGTFILFGRGKYAVKN